MFEFDDHLSEIVLKVRAPSLGELLADAALGLTTLQLRGRAPAPSYGERTLELRAGDAEALLVDWLNELIFLAERDSWVPTGVVVREIRDDYVRALLTGSSLAEPPAFVKAATLHGLRIGRDAGGLRADIVLDV